MNHYQSCKELAEKYTGMIRENKVGGELGLLVEVVQVGMWEY